MYFDVRLWALTAGLRSRITLGALIGLLSLCAGIARFVFLGKLLVAVFAAAPGSHLIAPAAGVAAAIALRALLEQARAKLAHRTAARVQEVLRLKLFDKIVALGPGWLAANRTGGVMLAVVDGVEQLQSFFGQYLPQLFISICAPIAIFAFIAWWDLPVATVMLAAAFVALLLPSAVHRRSRESAIARQQAMKAFGAEFLDAMQGLPTLKAFGQSRAYARTLADKARALSANTMRVLAASLLTRGITDLAIAVGAASALTLGVYRVAHGLMSLEALLIVLMAGTEIFRPLRDLRAVLHQGMVGESAAQGIHALLAAEETQPSGGTREVESWRGPLSITFDHVRFGYAGARKFALDDITFRIAPGERVGLVGASGAGKSSIVKLLLRLHDPAAGAVRFGDVDLRVVDPELIRRQIAVVAQDTYLFYGSVADNLRLGCPAASDAQVEAAARAANAHEFIVALPDGYQTRLGERGSTLSGGQRQRIAIARALLVDAPILILDEALSSVDAENEAVIQQALDRVMRGRTTLILAHRLSSVIEADTILVLDQGRVVQSGRHAALLAADGPYRRLMAAQIEEADNVDTQRTRDDASSLDARIDAPGAGGDERDEHSPQVREINADAAVVGWRPTLATLMRYIAPWRGQLAFTTAFGVGRVVAFIGVGVLGALALVAVKSGTPSTGLLITLMIVAPLAGLLHWLESRLAHDMAYRLLAEMRIALFDKLETLAPAYLLERRSGDLVALATHDVETVEYFYAHTVAPAFVAVAVPIAVLVVLAVFAWPLTLVLLPFLAYAAALPFYRRQRVDQAGSRARRALGELSAFVTETMQGLSELIAFRALGERRRRFVDTIRGYQCLRLNLLDDLTRQSEQLELVTGLGGLAVALAGALCVSHGMLDASLLPLLILVAVAAFLPVSEIAQVSRQLADTIASTRRLHVVESTRTSVADGCIRSIDRTAPCAVSFENVRYTYPGRRSAALRGVSFEVPTGSTVALVGASGAGKTTIANLLLRFWDPQEGAIRLWGTNLRELSLDGLCECIAVVAQDTYLFNDTLEANIRLARPQAAQGEIERALRQAALGPFVAALPDGLQTRVGERGMQLSGGQRQRIAIARAFLKDAPILVLDEATSHLDAISEDRVHTALAQLMRDRTTILIAHRLSTVRNADRILVIDRGQVVEAGTDRELIARRGAYWRLIERQLSAVRGSDAVPGPAALRSAQS